MRYLEGETTYILSNFTTGDTVTITVYKLSDNSVVINAAGCSEIGATGRFKYSFSQSISTKTEYLWVATNSIEEQQGKIILGGYPDSIKDKTDYIPSDLPEVPTAAELAAAHGAGAWITADVSALATSVEVATSEDNIRGADSDDLKTISDQIDTIPTSAGIADAVWDEDLTTHTTAKTGGWFVQKIKSITDAILAMVT